MQVVIHHVDLHNWTLCGYLTIKNLQSQQSAAACTAGSGGSVSGGAAETTTFFTGEIICEKHPFLTRKWDADESVDRKHWSKFLLHFKPFEKVQHRSLSSSSLYTPPPYYLWIYRIQGAVAYTIRLFAESFFGSYLRAASIRRNAYTNDLVLFSRRFS